MLKGNNQIIKYGYFTDSFPSDYIHVYKDSKNLNFPKFRAYSCHHRGFSLQIDTQWVLPIQLISFSRRRWYAKCWVLKSVEGEVLGMTQVLWWLYLTVAQPHLPAVSYQPRANKLNSFFFLNNSFDAIVDTGRHRYRYSKKTQLVLVFLAWSGRA